MTRTGKITTSWRSHCVVTGCQYVLATSMEFSLRPLHACAVTMVRPGHVVENRITLFVRPFGVYHVCGTFAGGSHYAYVTFKEFTINIRSKSSYNHLLSQWIWIHGIRNFFCNLLCFKNKRLSLMHKLHWEEEEEIEYNLDLAGSILGFLLKED